MRNLANSNWRTLDFVNTCAGMSGDEDRIREDEGEESEEDDDSEEEESDSEYDDPEGYVDSVSDEGKCTSICMLPCNTCV